MKDRVQGCVTAGIALVGAGVMVATPAVQQAPEVLRSVNAEVELAAASDNPIDAAVRLGQGFGESGVRFASSLATSPFGLLPILAAAAEGPNAAGANAALYAALEPYLSGPNYVIDPIIFAIDDVLPAPLGQDPATDPTEMNSSLVTQFRADVLLALRDQVREAFADANGVEGPTNPDQGVVYAAARLGAGLGDTTVRAVKSAALAPLGLVGVAQGLQQSFETGDNTALYNALESYIDAPNYVIDPVVFAVDDVLPAPTGQDPNTDPREMNESQITRFRADVLLGARDTVRETVRNVLNVDDVTNTSILASSQGATQTKAGDSGASTGTKKTNRPRPVQTALKTAHNEIKEAANKFERRLQKLTNPKTNKETKNEKNEKNDTGSSEK